MKAVITMEFDLSDPDERRDHLKIARIEDIIAVLAEVAEFRSDLRNGRTGDNFSAEQVADKLTEILSGYDDGLLFDVGIM
jgi:hypothetical protein